MEDSFEVDLVTWLRGNRKGGGCVVHIALCEMNLMVLEGNINRVMIQMKSRIIEDF